MAQSRAQMFELDGTDQQTCEVTRDGRYDGSAYIREVTHVAPDEQRQVRKQVAAALGTVEDKIGFWTPTSQFE